MTDLTSKIIAYESGEIETLDEIVEFFQELIDTDLAWKLQGSYGRMVVALIERGLCFPVIQEPIEA